MVVGEILGYHGRTVASIRHGNVSGGRLLFEKLLQNAPLGGHVAIQRIVDQDSQIEFLAALPVCDLRAVFVDVKLHVFPLDRGWLGIFLDRG